MKFIRIHRLGKLVESIVMELPSDALGIKIADFEFHNWTCTES